MKKSVSLTLHKNNVESRRKKELSKDVNFSKMVRDKDIRAYAFVGFGAKGEAYVCYDTGKVMPMWAFPAAVEWAIKVDMERDGPDEDWEAKI